ncbi:hypothetical protein GCM10027060_12150 [Nesterenkonia halophila]
MLLSGVPAGEEGVGIAGDGALVRGRALAVLVVRDHGDSARSLNLGWDVGYTHDRLSHHMRRRQDGPTGLDLPPAACLRVFYLVCRGGCAPGVGPES